MSLNDFPSCSPSVPSNMADHLSKVRDLLKERGIQEFEVHKSNGNESKNESKSVRKHKKQKIDAKQNELNVKSEGMNGDLFEKVMREKVKRERPNLIENEREKLLSIMVYRLIGWLEEVISISQTCLSTFRSTRSVYSHFRDFKKIRYQLDNVFVEALYLDQVVGICCIDDLRPTDCLVFQSIESEKQVSLNGKLRRFKSDLIFGDIITVELRIASGNFGNEILRTNITKVKIRRNEIIMRAKQMEVVFDMINTSGEEDEFARESESDEPEGTKD
eukprot:TRINITY_DN10270_c0_g1_i1.p1 TRINITY_DN10270_c0_g1~~TRINITY_DN10270_c0_g1_i1.p1  ORF type:complete len:275 (+),score=80.10 TRINITY_DN10270_c0_g1_i1:190-1014(+)